MLHATTGMNLTSKTRVNDLTPKQCKLCDSFCQVQKEANGILGVRRRGSGSCGKREWGDGDGVPGGSSEMLVGFSILTLLVVTWICSPCDNLSTCTL